MTEQKDTLKPLQVGVVGCGAMATGQHIPNIIKNPRLKLKWLCDINTQMLSEKAKQYGVLHTTTNYSDVLNDTEIDFVVLATTHSLRGQFISEAAEKKKGVYVEKPMAVNSREIGDILKAVRKSGIPFCVGHNRRSSPAVKDALAVLQKYEANPKIPSWRLDRNSWLRPQIPEENHCQVLIRINDDILTWKPWSFEDGMILNEMAHFIDLANLFMGVREPVNIYVMGSSRTDFTILIGYNDGSLATLAHSGCGTLDYPKELIEITYKGAMIAVDHSMEVRVSGIEGEPFRRTYPSPDTRVRTDKKGIEAFYESARQTIQERTKQHNNEIFIGFPEKGHYAHLDQFAQCVRGLAPSPCDVLSGAKVTMMVLKAIESCKLGLPVRFGPDEYQILSL
ncbi:MAG: Gfo/Idh/MocA family oxidoreductase [Candidatus Omnitrophica bacterium]|nr:Gfo/Idh/MocA family oxidoreductase [Candidatus Omnitrophota bacterium]